jgi:hypothetical protein
VFGSVVTIAFQSTFYSEKHQNNIFFNLFLTVTHQNNPKTLKELVLRKNIEF